MKPYGKMLAAKLGFALMKAAGYGQSAQQYSTMSKELGSWFGGPTASGKNVTADNVMALTAVWGCIRILSEAIGAIPWGIYQRDPSNPKNSTPAPDHPLSQVLTQRPNRDMTSVEFREAKTTNLCQAGNAYSLIDRLGDQVTSLYPLRASMVQAKKKDGGNTKLAIQQGEVFYSVLDRGVWEDYPREKIWHVKGFGSDGLCGFSPIGLSREAFGAALAADEFGARFFAQGGKPSGVVTIPSWLTADQRGIARENLNQMLGGISNAHKFALFEGGMKPEPWGELSLDDMQYVLLRRFNIQEICRLFRIPPHMLADVERGASYASIEQMSSEFVMFSLMPYFTRFEASVQRWLFPIGDQGKYFLRFNYEGLLRADSEARSKFYASALQNGWMSRNEVRALENRNTVAGLDEYTVQTNLTPADMLQALAASMVASNTAKPTPPKELPAPVIPERKESPIILAVNVAPAAVTFSPVIEGAKVTVPPPDFSKMPQPQVTVGGTNIEMPKSMKITVEGMEGVGDLLTQNLLSNMTLGDSTVKALEALRAASQQKRKVIYDKTGAVVGIEPVNT